jgi:hypothetical protein
MSEERLHTVILVAFWVMCLAIMGGILGIVAAIPRRGGWDDVLSEAMPFLVPYLLVAGMAWFLRRNGLALALLFLGVMVVGAFGTFARCVMLQEHLEFAAAEAAGHRMMICGPPLSLLMLGLELLGMALILVVALGVVVVETIRKAVRPTAPDSEFSPAGWASSSEGITRTDDRFRGGRGGDR